MAVLTLAQKGSPVPFIAAALGEFVNDVSPNTLTVCWQAGNTLQEGNKAATSTLEHDGRTIVGEAAVVAELAKLAGADQAEDQQQWVQFATERLATKNFAALDAALAEANHHLVMRSYVAGYAATAADAALWGALRASPIVQRNLKDRTPMLGDHLVRWYTHVATQPFVNRLVEAQAAVPKEKPQSVDQGSFDLGLEGVENGGVVTRFPPEPSGYLHIGHAKAALLNEYFARTYNGKLIVRFDDTNPTKEKAEFEDSIMEDLRLLGIHADTITHTSDYFQQIYEYALLLIKRGLAYVDDTDQATMRDERGRGIASRCRDLSVEDNLARFEQMRQATEFGQTCCLRAKISVDCPNKAMRDPAIYRCNLTAHHRTGDFWKIYPMYDFCCPIVDSLEGVTHALRSMEYRDRNPLYEWFFPALDLRPVAIKDFSRMNFVYTLLSKRKLQWFVDQGFVTGWDDPRFPTVRGIYRRGMTIDALRQYVLMQGASQKNMLLEWDKIWALNKKLIDPVAPRHTALLKQGLVPATIVDAPATPEIRELPKHKKNPELGTKRTVFSSLVFIDQADAASFEQNEEITMMDWGNAIVESIERSSEGTVTALSLRLHLEGDVKTTKKKITWLGQAPDLHPVEAMLVDYDYLITKKRLEEDDSVEDVLTPVTEFTDPAIVDANVDQLQQGAIIQLERRGYYIVDKTRAQSDLGFVTLIKIPDGKAANLASKHKEVPSAEPKKSKAGKSNPWGKKVTSAAQPAAKSSNPDEALNLPKPEEVSSMYVTRPVYGDVALDTPEQVSSMYSTKKYC
ncbi:glutamate--tRNA ligase [Coemansia guatemalensis]|uniref:Probable glutamate--tRNA ligase, cytoplasmic n=1 Tax=Coemansia guatemalensis TaxID=2761395 RepID=A0A9W8HZG8_9FUNG|nr:glutamate--tRNA ligase [Coemansia guatemalensis]